jgi:hypothetical protein
MHQQVNKNTNSALDLSQVTFKPRASKVKQPMMDSMLDATKLHNKYQFDA